MRKLVDLNLYSPPTRLSLFEDRVNKGSEESTNWIVSAVLTPVFFSPVNCD